MEISDRGTVKLFDQALDVRQEPLMRAPVPDCAISNRHGIQIDDAAGEYHN